MDRGSLAPLTAAVESRLADELTQRIAQCNAVLVSDYAKGVCTPGLLRHILATAEQQGVPVIVDPRSFAYYQRYRGATLVIPNRTSAS